MAQEMPAIYLTVLHIGALVRSSKRLSEDTAILNVSNVSLPVTLKYTADGSKIYILVIAFFAFFAFPHPPSAR